MTFLIIFLAISNMAVGYGFAVYLGKGQKPVQITIGRLRKPLPETTLPIAETFQQRTAPAEGGVRSASSQPISSGSDDQAEESEPTPVSDSTPFAKVDAHARQGAEKPLSPKVPQLDVSDLMPPSQPAVESAKREEAVETLSEVVAADPQVDESPQVVPGETAVESSDEVPIAADKDPAAPNPDVVEQQPAAAGDSTEIFEQPIQEVAIATELEASNSVDNLEKFAAASDAEENDSAEEAAEEVEAEVKETDELELLAQQLQTAVARSGDEDVAEGAERIEEVSKESAGADPDASNINDSPQTDETSDEASMLEGIEAFQAHLKQQETATSPPTEMAPVDSSSLEPEILAGIQSFRTQLAEKTVAAPTIPSDVNEDDEQLKTATAS